MEDYEPWRIRRYRSRLIVPTATPWCWVVAHPGPNEFGARADEYRIVSPVFGSIEAAQKWIDQGCPDGTEEGLLDGCEAVPLAERGFGER